GRRRLLDERTRERLVEADAAHLAQELARRDAAARLAARQRAAGSVRARMERVGAAAPLDVERQRAHRAGDDAALAGGRRHRPLAMDPERFAAERLAPHAVVDAGDA